MRHAGQCRCDRRLLPALLRCACRGRAPCLPLALLLLLALLAVLSVCVPLLLHPDPPHPRSRTPAPLPQAAARVPPAPPSSDVIPSPRAGVVGANSSLSPGAGGGRLSLTVIPRGRLGNQMFQYASLLGIADVNDREPFVSSSCKVTHYFANVSVSDRPVSPWTTLEEANYAERDPTLDRLPPEHVRLKGFFQSWRYFATVSQRVLRAFVFLPDVELAVRKLFANHTSDVAGRDVVKIGVHVRRTDMLHKITRKQGYVPAPLSYLRKAVQHMRGRFGNRSTVFFLVSDDPAWCAKHLLEKRVRLVDPAPSVVHLGFLALCDHVIMTVGTFGWWAAYLSGGHVVYYAGFPRAGSEIAEGFNRTDFYLPHWLGIGD